MRWKPACLRGSGSSAAVVGTRCAACAYAAGVCSCMHTAYGEVWMLLLCVICCDAFVVSVFCVPVGVPVCVFV